MKVPKYDVLPADMTRTVDFQRVCASICRAAADLSEVDVLRRREVEALLVALVPQQTQSEPVRHLHVAAVELLRVRGGVGQHGCRLLNEPRIQERRVTGKPF